MLKPSIAQNPAHKPQLPSVSIPQVKVALCQLLVTADKDKNIKTATTAIKVQVTCRSCVVAQWRCCSSTQACSLHCICWMQEAAGNGAELVILPEMWNCPYSNDSFPTYAEDIEGNASPSVDALAQVGALWTHSMWLAGETTKAMGTMDAMDAISLLLSSVITLCPF
jgi:omega-amidase